MLKKMILYFLGTASSSLVSFLFLPLFTSRFSTSVYGNFDLSYTLIIMFVSVLFMEVWVYLLKHMYNSNINELSINLTNIAFISLICGFIFTILFAIISLILNLENWFLFIILGLTMFLQNIYQFYTRGKQKEVLYVISGISITIIQVILNLIFILIFNFGIESLIYSQIFSRFLVVVFLEFKLSILSMLKFRLIQKKILVKIFKFSFPFAINALAFWGMTNINRIFAFIYFDSSVNGLIAVASKFAMILSILTSVFILVWQESAFSLNTDSEKNLFYSRILTNLLIIGSLGVFFAIPVVNYLFPYFVDSSYYEASILLPIYFAAALFSTINGFFGQIFGAEEKTKFLTYSTIGGAIINISFLYLFYKMIGIMVIPIALLISTAVNSVIRYFLVKKITRIKANSKAVIISLVLLMVSITLSYFDINNIQIFILFLLTLILYFIILRDEIIQMIRSLFIKKE